MNNCKEKLCNNPIHARNLCLKHYKRLMRKIKNGSIADNYKPLDGRDKKGKFIKGYKHLQISKEKISEKMSKLRKGIKFTEEHKKKLSEIKKSKHGALANNWKGGRTNETRLLRASNANKEWREKVFSRDDWTCQHCGAKGYVEAHHIFAWADYPELRFDVDNGITFCVDCHHIYDTRTRGKNV